MPTSVPVLCRSCGENIKFVKTKGGKTMPVNAEPDPEGTLTINTDIHTGEEVVEHVGKIDSQGTLWQEYRYRSHFATCPDRLVWRNRQR
jgi:hypothetical protein